jgi:SAM-dependent methyltransferase
MSERADLEIIASLVPPGSRVLDLGCGGGELLAHLQQHRGCSGYGIEIADANVLACAQRGVNVIQLNLEDGLALFEDASFDVVLQLETLQNLRHTERMLRETARVGRIGIVSFPNFAHWPNRLRARRRAGDRAALPGTRPTSASAHADFELWRARSACTSATAGLQHGRACAGPTQGQRRCSHRALLTQVRLRLRNASRLLTGAAVDQTPVVNCIRVQAWAAGGTVCAGCSAPPCGVPGARPMARRQLTRELRSLRSNSRDEVRSRGVLRTLAMGPALLGAA